MAKEYIRRVDIMRQLTASDMQKKLRNGNGEDAYAAFLKMVNDAPAADVAEVKHGEWIDDYYDMLCSECGKQWSYFDNDTQDFKHCPNCGAKMDGKRREK